MYHDLNAAGARLVYFKSERFASIIYVLFVVLYRISASAARLKGPVIGSCAGLVKTVSPSAVHLRPIVATRVTRRKKDAKVR